MIHPIDLSSYIKNSNDKLCLSSILDIDIEEQNKIIKQKFYHQILKIKIFVLSHHVLEKDFPR